MMFSSYSSPSIWCYFQLIIFLAFLAHFTSANPIKRLHNDTLITPRLNGEFRIMNCDSAQEDAINEAIHEIISVAYSTGDRVIRLYDLLNVADVNFDAFTPIDWSTYDTFETVFGIQLYSQGTNHLGLDALEVYYESCMKLYNGASNIGGQSLDIWCDSGWETNTNTQGSYYLLEDGSIDTNYVWDNSGNNFGWIEPTASIDGPYTCSNPNIGKLAGYTVNGPTGDLSIITLCDSIINPMIDSGTTLTSQAGTIYAQNEMSLDDIIDGSLTLLLVHELSHTFAVMGSSGAFSDFSYGDGLAYGWRAILGLAGESTAQALYNADTIAFFSAAMYLSQNTWWNGLSMPLINSAVYEEDITFQS